ncbi:hypothetical protein ABMC88_18460 [Sulfitobacter sp. HNIBRBA2951]|uniref:hypothetical protein n=1 Tax=Sulfitobacter aquimarinus TaxID=3158557 RepID=UPI0032DEF950
MISDCCCENHDLLKSLDETGDNDELYEELLTSCVEMGDEFACYLKACNVSSGDEDVDSTSLYVAALKDLAEKHNPWALAELALHYIFNGIDKEEEELGRRYLLIGALFGEKRAQYYLAYQLKLDGRNDELAKRLMLASAAQGYERAENALKKNI